MLVNNAAYPRGNDRVPLPELDEAVWRKVLDIKLTGAFLLCKRVVPIMVGQKWGRIINLSSIAGKRGAPNTAAYNAANFGIQGLTQSLAMEVARHGVTVNAVCPGTIDTARMDVLGRGGGLAAAARPHPDGPGRVRRGGRGPHRVPVLARRRVHDRPVRQHRRRRGHVVRRARRTAPK